MTVFKIDNPWREDCRQHVAIMTEQYRERQKERQAARRRVSAMNADTKGSVSHSPSERDVSAMNAGNIPPYTPQDRALNKEEPNIKVSSVPSTYGQDDDAHLPYPAPESEEELAGIWLPCLTGANCPLA